MRRYGWRASPSACAAITPAPTASAPPPPAWPVKLRSPRPRYKSFAARSPILRLPGSRTKYRSSTTRTGSTTWKASVAPAWVSVGLGSRSGSMSVNGMVRPCSCPASDKLARGAQDKEHAMPATAQTAIAVIGIDIGKNSFHVVGQDTRGQIILRQKWSRHQVEARFANMPPCLIGMEACVGAHHLGRRLKALGHDARLMPAKYVRPYSKGQKNDFRDAEAVQRPTMKFVATKTVEQLD